MGQTGHPDGKEADPMNKLRITGLVKLMNHVRESLTTGIPPDKEMEFRRMVKENLRQVEEICREYKTSPKKLPAPTYRAYRYLKELDLTQLPVAKETGAPTPQRLRIKNLIANCKAIQDELRQLTESNQKRKKPLSVKDARVMVLLVHIRNLVQLVEKMTARAGGGLGLLSPQSRRAYQWLCYLSERRTWTAIWQPCIWRTHRFRRLRNSPNSIPNGLTCRYAFSCITCR
jgi:hypothetical protein